MKETCCCDDFPVYILNTKVIIAAGIVQDDSINRWNGKNDRIRATDLLIP